MLNPPRPSNPDGWLGSCDPTSPAWNTEFAFYDPTPFNRSSLDPMSSASSRTFIYDHRAAMDPCQHPHLLRQHGQFVNHFRGPAPKTTITPFFSYSPSLLHRDITAAIPLAWVAEVDDPDWELKLDQRLHFRGSNTGRSSRGDKSSQVF